MTDVVANGAETKYLPSKITRYVTSFTRILFGLVFLWPFLDKFLGLGYSTCRNGETGKIEFMCDSAWLAGGKPTQGYLKSSAGEFGGEPTGLYGELFKGWGDFAIGGFRPIDWVFMIALLGVGIALILGIGTRIAAFSAGALLVFMFIAKFDNSTNPVFDYHIVYTVAICAIVGVEAKFQQIGLGKWWRSLPLVQKNKWLI